MKIMMSNIQQLNWIKTLQRYFADTTILMAPNEGIGINLNLSKKTRNLLWVDSIILANFVKNKDKRKSKKLLKFKNNN
jgi:hypothetical protein